MVIARHFKNINKPISILTIFLPACLAVWTASMSYHNNPNSIIPDRGLERSIREQIGKPLGVITSADCQGVRELDLSDSSYNSNLEGLQYFVDLEKLRSTAGLISDISALSGLTELREINLSSNRIKDLSPLSELINLEKLILQNNKVNDLQSLSSLINLKYLVIGQNPVEYSSDGFLPLSNLNGLAIGSYADYEIVVGRDELKSPYANRIGAFGFRLHTASVRDLIQ